MLTASSSRQEQARRRELCVKAGGMQAQMLVLMGSVHLPVTVSRLSGAGGHEPRCWALLPFPHWGSPSWAASWSPGPWGSAVRESFAGGRLRG